MSKYANQKAVTATAKERLLTVMREMGCARLDDLAEHLDWSENYVRMNAEVLVDEGKLTAIKSKMGPPRKAPDGSLIHNKRQYIYGDGTPEQAAA